MIGVFTSLFFSFSLFLAAPGTVADQSRTETLAAAQQSPSAVTVWYMGHSGFAVRVGTKLLVFDYQTEHGTPAADPAAGGLEDGTIEATDLEGLDVYVFVTHSHSDHYDTAILGWEREVQGIEYFFGWEAGDNPEHHYLVGPRATAEIDGMQIFTINSHHSGVPEVAYLVFVDGRWIYHNGDYLQDYIPDFQYLSTLTNHMDLVFHAGVTNEEWQYTHQGYYLMDHFSPGVFFPMHRGGREEEAAEFQLAMTARGYDTFVPVPLRRGDRFVIDRE